MLQRSVVDDAHATVEHNCEDIPTLGVRLLYPKFTPLSVTHESPDNGALSRTSLLTTGASKVYTAADVPVRDCTTRTYALPAPLGPSPQVTVDTDDHDVVKQEPACVATVGVGA
jgi:hypothetical protein